MVHRKWVLNTHDRGPKKIHHLKERKKVVVLHLEMTPLSKYLEKVLNGVFIDVKVSHW
jgi:hypothetical protein